MGGFFESINLPGSDHDAVDNALRDWLSRKGFREIDDPVLDLCPEGERAYYLFWNDRWSIILYSDFGEQERLMFELGGGRPVMHLWLHDSDLWGYELYRDRRAVSAFNSNPKYFGSIEPPAAPNDLSVLVDLCAIRGIVSSDLEKIQKQKGLFKENACTAFAEAIGAGPAASQYQYAAHSPAGTEGFSAVHRRFRRRSYHPMGKFNLHAARVGPPQEARPAAFPMPGFPRGMRILIEIMRIVAIPLGWLLGGLLILRMKVAGFPGKEGGAQTQAPPGECTFEEGWLVNRKRRCRIKLPQGTEPSSAPGMLPFKLRGKEVFSRTMPASEAANRLANMQPQFLVEDFNFHAGGLPAKRLRTKHAGKPESIYTEYYLQSPAAVYHFLLYAESPADTDTFEAFQKAIDSFEILDPPPDGN